MAFNYVVWPFPPNWTQPVRETLDWLTDVIGAYRGNEQRIEVRSKPRQSFEYTSTVKNNESAIADNLLWGNQNLPWGLPLWLGRTTLGASVSIGATSLTVNTVNKGFYEGGYAIILKDSLNYEVVEIDTLTDTTITPVDPTTGAWASGTRVYPLVIARMPGSITSRRITDALTELGISFNCDPATTSPNIPSSTAAVTYNGYEVILRKPNWAEPLQFGNDYESALVDYQTGAVAGFATNDFPRLSRRFQWVFKNTADLVEFRKLLGRLKGRLKAVYMPTWMADFQLYSTELSSSTSIKVKTNEFHRLVGTDPALKTLMIMINDVPIYKTIQSTSVTGAYTTLTLTTTIGVALNSTTVQRICLMHLCRLTTDQVTINYLSDSVATVDANFTLVKA